MEDWQKIVLGVVVFVILVWIYRRMSAHGYYRAPNGKILVLKTVTMPNGQSEFMSYSASGPKLTDVEKAYLNAPVLDLTKVDTGEVGTTLFSKGKSFMGWGFGYYTSQKSIIDVTFDMLTSKLTAVMGKAQPVELTKITELEA